LKAAHGIEKIDLHARLDVSAALRPCWRAGSLPEHAAKAAEEIAEVVHVELLRAATGAGRLLAPLLVAARLLGVETGGQTGLTEFVIEFAFFFVAQDVVGDRDILEFALGVLIAGVDIGMIFTREFSKRAFDLILTRRFRYAKGFVVIAKLHRHCR
jgi:hypothetical protein